MTSRRGPWLTAPLATLLLAAATATLVEGRPARLPGIAMGSPVVLHVERVAALFALAVALLSVLREARRGRLPTQLSTGGLAYEAAAAWETEAAAEELQRRVDALQDQVAGLLRLHVEAPEAPD